jgi:dihydrodipicolinate synthase/N-acetylneuraminate lyase
MTSDDAGRRSTELAGSGSPVRSLAALPPVSQRPLGGGADAVVTPRTVEGISAILLPFTADGSIDVGGFERHLTRTLAAGLIPAVNMDTGYVNLLTPGQRREMLSRTAGIVANTNAPASRVADGGDPTRAIPSEATDGAPRRPRPRFVAGAFVDDRPGAALDVGACLAAAEEILSCGGVPVIFPSHGMGSADDAALIRFFESLDRRLGEFIGFELSPRFAPFGRLFSETVYRRLLDLPSCRGAKHSSLSRREEFRRLAWRDEVRPDFRVYTGNDLAIDMVRYGSDYLLGLSSLGPDWFAARDRLLAAGDPDFLEWNDLLQHLGNLAFRDPVPAYKHSVAQVLRLRSPVPPATSTFTASRSPRLTAGSPSRLGDGDERLGKPTSAESEHRTYEGSGATHPQKTA